MPEASRLLIIGGGHMGQALVSGLRRQQWEESRIAVSDPDPHSHQILSEFGLTQLYYENSVAYAKSRPTVVLLAVKPNTLVVTATEMAPWMMTETPLLMTVAAGVRAADLTRWTGAHCPVVRVMPNTPALVGAGMSVLYAAKDVLPAHRAQAEQIMQSVGEVLWVEDEALMDVATAVSGSGPAYFFLFMQAMMEGACRMGFSKEQARMLVLETARGAQQLAALESESLSELCRRVSSKGGTTEAALEVLEKGGLPDLMMRALDAAQQRARALGEENSRA